MSCCCCCCCGGDSDSKPENIPFGPEMKRRCRDVFWLLLFALFVAGLVVIAAFAIKEGDVARFNHGTDMYGGVCGLDRTVNGTRYDLRNKGHLYWPNVLSLKTQLCVHKCPNGTISEQDIANIFKGAATKLDLNISLGKLVCYYNVEPTVQAVVDGKCWPTYPAKSVLGRCMPNLVDISAVDKIIGFFFSNASAAANGTSDGTDIDWKNPSSILDAAKSIVASLNARQVLTRVLHDVAAAWKMILILGFASFAVGFVWLFFLRWFAGVIVWSCVLGALAGLGALTLYVWVASRRAARDVQSASATVLEDDKVMAEFLSYAVNALLVVDTLAVVFVVLMRNRIRLAVGVVQEASVALRSLPCLVTGVPLCTFAAVGLFLAYWIVVGLLLATAGLKPGLETKSIAHIDLPDRILRYMTIYHLFGLFWCVEFILAVSKMTTAGAIAQWYWTKRATTPPALWRALRYSAGSAALGSLLVATVSALRTLLEWYDGRRRKKALKGPVDAALCCVRCCLWCFDRCIRFLTKNAYVVVAITGKSFCGAGREAAETLAKNPVRVVTINIVSGFFLLLTRVAIASATAVIAAAVLHRDEDLKYWYVPVAIVFVVALAVASVFTVVYDMAVKTILFSFCHDEAVLGEAHSNRLRKFMSKKKRSADKEARQEAHDVEMQKKAEEDAPTN
eukprot:m51a1_g7956 hypothetical protein (677) ;mRNA; f:188581-191610